MKQRALTVGLVVLATALTGCGTRSANDGSDSFLVSASLYPIAEIVERVGGDYVEVVNLTPPGTDAHDVELTAKQMQMLENSDVVFYFGDDFQPVIEKAITSLTATPAIDLFDSVELLDAALDTEHKDEHGHDEGEHDPHVWLDPANMIAMTEKVTSILLELQPENKEKISANSAAYIDKLSELGDFLDSTIGKSPTESTSRCAEQNLYTSHQGFRYLAHRAGLTLVPIAGINPDEQVSAQYLESLASSLQGKDITIFYESLIPSATAEALVQSLQVSTEVLNPLEGLTVEDIGKGVTYVNAQRQNIEKIAKALRCA